MKLVYGIQTLALFAAPIIAENAFDNDPDYSNDYGDDGEFNEAAYEAKIAAERKGQGQLRSMSMKFDGWVGPFTYDGVQLVAIGANKDNFAEVLPGETLGCTVYQPSKTWGYADFNYICETVNMLGGILTDCRDIDDDADGGLCPNAPDKSFILTYENWGTGESTGPDVWASDTTFIREFAGFDSNSFGIGQGDFPSKGSNDAGSGGFDDCGAVSSTYAILVYACEDFNANQAGPDTFSGPEDLMGECGGTDTSSLYGCWCQALVDDDIPLMGRPVDAMDEACLRYAHCMQCGNCGTREVSATVTDCDNIDCNGDACCQCAADFVRDANGLVLDINNVMLTSTDCVRNIVPPSC